MPGVPGIGTENRGPTDRRIGDLEAVLAAAPGHEALEAARDLLIAHAEEARLSRKLVDLRDDVAAPRAAWTTSAVRAAGPRAGWPLAARAWVPEHRGAARAGAPGQVAGRDRRNPQGAFAAAGRHGRPPPAPASAANSAVT